MNIHDLCAARWQIDEGVENLSTCCSWLYMVLKYATACSGEDDSMSWQVLNDWDINLTQTAIPRRWATVSAFLFKTSNSRSQIDAKSLKQFNNSRGLFQNLAAFHEVVKVNTIFYTSCNGNSGNSEVLRFVSSCHPHLTNSNERWIVCVVLRRAKRKMICDLAKEQPETYSLSS